MRKWKYYRADVEEVRTPNVFPGPLDIEAGDRFVHYLRSGGTDYFGVFAETARITKWLAAQPAEVGLTEITAADVPQPNWHSHLCALRMEGWDGIGLAPVSHLRVVEGAVPEVVEDDGEMVLAVRVGAAGDGPLPLNTPSLDLLLGAGVETIAQARSTDLTEISGIGEKTAAKILESLPAPMAVLHVAGADREGLIGAAVRLEDLEGAVVAPHAFG